MIKKITILLFIVLLFSSANNNTCVFGSTYTNNNTNTSRLITLNTVKFDNVLYISIREFSDKTKSNIDYYNVELGYYNKVLYVDDGLNFSKHTTGSKEVFKNEKYYTCDNKSLLVDNILYIPLDMLKILTDIDKIILDNNKATIEIKYRNDEYKNSDILKTRKSEISYSIKNEYDEPISNVIVKKFIIFDKYKQDLNFSINPFLVYDIYESIFKTIGNSNSYGVFTEKLDNPIINQYTSYIEVYQVDKNLKEYFLVDYTPETKTINLVLSDDNKYLSGELPTEKDYAGYIYKLKYSLFFNVKNKEGNPLDSSKLILSEVTDNNQIVSYGLMGETDKFGQTKKYFRFPRFYEINSKISIIYNGREFEESVLIKPNNDEIFINININSNSKT